MLPARFVSFDKPWGISPPSKPASPVTVQSGVRAGSDGIRVAPMQPVASCNHCNSENCCNSLWPMKDLPRHARPAGVLGPFTWCGLTVYVAVAGPEHESQSTIEYRRAALNTHLESLTIDVELPQARKEVVGIAGFEREVPDNKYTLEEVSAHRHKDDAWIAVGDKVLDVTKWQHQHPGGADVLMEVAGQDATGGEQEEEMEHRQDNTDTQVCEVCTLSTGSGSIQCECSGTELIPRAPASPMDLSKPSPEVEAEVTTILAQLKTMLGSSESLRAMLPQLAINYVCEDVEDDDEEGIEMELVVKFKARKGFDGQHPMCVEARNALGARGRCGGR